MSSNDIAIILEHVDDRFNLLAEMMQTMLDHQNAMQRKLDRIDDMQKQHGLRLNNIESRLSTLEMPGRA